MVSSIYTIILHVPKSDFAFSLYTKGRSFQEASYANLISFKILSFSLKSKQSCIENDNILKEMRFA